MSQEPVSHELNFRPQGPTGEPQADARHSGVTPEQLAETVDQIRTHFSRSQRRLDRIEREHESLARYIRVLWLALGLVTVSFGMVLWLEMPARIGQRAVLKDLPVIQDTTKPSVAKALPVSPPSPIPLQPAGASTPKTAAPRDAAPSLPEDNVPRQRVDFHLGSNQTGQVAPGIFLTIKGADINHQQVNGWLRKSSDGRIVLIRDQATQKYMSFESSEDAQPSFLVFTRIDSGGVAGYMMIPPSHSGPGD